VEQMSDLNLVVKFQLAGDPQIHVNGVARMKVDGRGTLLLYDGTGELVSSIKTADLQSFSIRTFPCPQALAA
jgi:hypothetical protein